jgi:hypothetical protein
MGSSSSTETNGKIKDLAWAKPAQKIDPPVGLADVLVGLRLLDEDADRAKSQCDEPLQGTASVQIIEAGALDVTKKLTSWAKNYGGLSGVAVLAAGGVATILKIFTKSSISNSIIVILFGGGFFLLSAVAVALALAIRGDVEARASVTSARLVARGHVAATFLQATAALGDTPDPSPGTAQAASTASPDPQPAALWVRPMSLGDQDSAPWRPVLAYSKFSQDGPTLEQTLYFVQVTAGTPPEWLTYHDLDGWKVSAADPGK